MNVTATCIKCGRSRSLSAQVMARNPRCMYCGGDTEMSEGDLAAVEALHSTSNTGSRQKVRVDCPVCGRAQTTTPCSIDQCTYCACPYTVSDDGQSAMPGPPDTVLHDELPEDHEAARQNLLDTLGEFVAPGEAKGSLMIRLALDAISWRYVRGNIDQDETRLMGLALRAAEDQLQGRLDANLIPLPPSDAADIIVQCICIDYENSIEHLADGGSAIRIITSKTKVSGIGGTEAVAIGAVLGGLTGAMIGAHVGGDQEYEICEYLQVDLRPTKEGSAMEFSSGSNTGKELDSTAKQEAIAETIQSSLPGMTLRPVLLKAVYGNWLRAISTLSLRPEPLANRLASLGPGLETLNDLAR